MVRGEEEHWGVSWPGPQGCGPPGSQAARIPPAAASDLHPFQPRLEDTSSKWVLHVPLHLGVWTRSLSLRLPCDRPRAQAFFTCDEDSPAGERITGSPQGLRAPVEGEADSCLVPGPCTMLSTTCGASLNPCLTVRQELSSSPFYRWDS